MHYHRLANLLLLHYLQSHANTNQEGFIKGCNGVKVRVGNMELWQGETQGNRKNIGQDISQVHKCGNSPKTCHDIFIPFIKIRHFIHFFLFFFLSFFFFLFIYFLILPQFIDFFSLFFLLFFFFNPPCIPPHLNVRTSRANPHTWSQAQQ